MVAIIGLDVATVSLICEEAAAKSGEPISIANYLVDGNYAVSGTSISNYVISVIEDAINVDTGAKAACVAAAEIAPSKGARMGNA